MSGLAEKGWDHISIDGPYIVVPFRLYDVLARYLGQSHHWPFARIQMCQH